MHNRKNPPEQLSRDQLRALVREYTRGALRNVIGTFMDIFGPHVADTSIHFQEGDIELPNIGGHEMDTLFVGGPVPNYTDRIPIWVANDQASLRAGPAIRAGEFTPVVSNTTNIASTVDAQPAQFMNFGDRVMVGYTFGNIQATSGSAGISFDITVPLPPSINFVDVVRAAGTVGSAFGATAISGFVRANSGAMTLRVITSAPGTTSAFALRATVMYQIQ